jgi:5-methylthioadenosine/S-adenosylhomocysteine deaminase
MKTVFEKCALILPDRRVATGDLAVEGAEIVAIEEYPVAQPTRAILPGLVNCHGHTAMTLLRGVGGGLPLQRWLEEAIFPVEAKMTPADIAAGMTWGALEMLAGGTTCVADMYDFPAAGAAALSAVGMKGNLCRVGLAFPGGNPPGRLEECVAFAAADHGPVVKGDLCIHSEYLTDEAFCRALAAANRTLKRPVHVHVSETKAEHEACLRRHGKTPMAYLVDTGLLAEGGYAAHCVWCTDGDFELMRAHNVTLVHNPTSNLKLGSGFARLPAALAAGVRVALGTDGCASNDNLNLFEEMHLASLIHKGIARDPTVVTAWEVLEMATVNGAEALGRPESGVLAPGRRADLCVLDLTRLHLAPATDLPNLLVHSAQASDVAETWVDGRCLYRRGAFPMVDAAAARAAFCAAVAHLRGDMV